jgi:glycosyltransferase involved in cell wall biosynthesis
LSTTTTESIAATTANPIPAATAGPNAPATAESDAPSKPGDTAVDAPVGITFVVPMYNVAPYLPDFLRSLETQEPGRYDLEVIFVDDGSPDESGDIARTWLRSSAFRGSVISTPNGGVSSARNIGMAAATGEWIAFPDPDDFLHPAYLREATKFMRSPRGMRSNVIATNVLRYNEETKETRDVHALRFKFKGTAKTVDLSRSPHYIQLFVNSAFMRLNELRSAGAQFPADIRQSEDAIFIASFLATFDKPVLGVVPEAIYSYRQRQDKTSALDTSLSDPRSYIDRFKRGYLPLLRSLAAHGEVPEWLGNLVLYEYRWPITRELVPQSKAHVLDTNQQEEFLRTASEILQYFPDEWILGFRVISLPLEAKYLLLALKGSPLPDDAVHIHKLDADRNLMQLRYYFVGELPSEEFRIRAKPVQPVAAKVRGLPYFGQQLLRERIVWLPANSWLAVDIGGRRRPLKFGRPSLPEFAVTERAIWRQFREALPSAPTRSSVPAGAASKSPYRRARAAARRSLEATTRTMTRVVDTVESRRARRRRREVELVRKLAAGKRARQRYADAWVFSDRLSMAQDNAEHVYRYVSSHHPDVNAWFVMRRDSPDWARLKADGFRLVEYRSREHHVLMLNAAHVVSSHLDVEFARPIEDRFYPSKQRWKFTFLQHGIVLHDMAAWFNQKNLDVLVTTTRAEYDAITADGSPYQLTTKEVALTGLARHDALLKKRRAMSEDSRNVILIAPTWREALFKPKSGWGATRELIDDFWQSDYAKSWFGLLRSAELLEGARANGHEVWFLPHPMLQPHVTQEDLPSGVRLVRYSDGDIQDVIAQARVMVTDYSSLAFEAAFLQTPVVYFQFDVRHMFTGGHFYQKGYFEYERDGFGPIVTTLEDAVGTIVNAASGAKAPEPYRTRAEYTFPFRDGNNCERVVQAIKSLKTPVPPV